MTGRGIEFQDAISISLFVTYISLLKNTDFTALNILYVALRDQDRGTGQTLSPEYYMNNFTIWNNRGFPSNSEDRFYTYINSILRSFLRKPFNIFSKKASSFCNNFTSLSFSMLR